MKDLSIRTPVTTKRAGPKTEDLLNEQRSLQQENPPKQKTGKDTNSILEQLLIELDKPENNDLAERLVLEMLSRLMKPPTIPAHLIEAITKGGGDYHYLPWWHYLWAKRVWFSISISCVMALLLGYVFNMWSIWLQPFIITTIGCASIYMQYQIFGPKIQKSNKDRNKHLRNELIFLILCSIILFMLLLIIRMIN